MSYEAKLMSYIDSHREEIIAFMQKLIQTESITGNESRIAALMAEECRKDGLEVEVVEASKNRSSVVARYHGTIGKPKAIMYSHYDVVPPGDPKTWTYPPFSGTIADGKIWGRGTCDNKIATCGLTMAYRVIKALGIKLKGDMIFTHVADEERGGKQGFKVLIDNGYGEGVDYLFYAHGGTGKEISIAANGSRNWIITVKGKGAHTSRLEDGVNAVVKASTLISRLQKLADEVNTRKHLVPGTDTYMRSRFSINKCSGWTANNNVPDSCEVLIDRRFTPAETAEQTEKEIVKVIDQMKSEDPQFEATLHSDPDNWMELSVSSANSELVKSLQRVSEKMIGFKPKPSGGSHSSDHGWFSSKHHKPLASYGVGGEGGHSANEYAKLDDVILTTKVYALFMIDLLGAE